jgi:hypothetical protein
MRVIMAVVGAMAMWAATAAADPAKLAAELIAVGKRAQAHASPPLAFDLGAAEDDIPATRPCTRPTAAERAALRRQVEAADSNGLGLGIMRFGCMSPAGIILDLIADPLEKDRETSVWRVVRAGAAGVTTLAEYSGTPTREWMEWANEVTLHALVLTDLDGDGELDAVIAQDRREGGAQHSDVTVSRWLSTTGARTTLGKVVDQIQLAVHQPADPRAVVLRIDPYGGEPDDELGGASYRCVQATGALAICPAVEPVRTLDHARKIAAWFAGGHFGPHEGPVPDRTALAELLAPLAVLGVTPAEASRLVALAEPATPAAAIGYEISRAQRLPAARYRGELERLHDHRADRLMAMLGDTACPTASRAAVQAVRPRLAAWIAAHDPAALIAHGECKAGAACVWSHAQPIGVSAACAAGDQAYYQVNWSYLDPTGQQRLARAGLFHDRAGALTLVASATAVGDNVPDDCAACSPPPIAQLEVKWYRRRASLIAMAVGAQDAPPGAITVDVDGTAVAATTGTAGWQVFEDPEYTEAVTAPDVVRNEQPNHQVAYLHWDAGWKPLATFEPPTPATPVPKLDGAALWLWQEARKSAAHGTIASFEIARWQRDAAYRAEVQQALALMGADKPSLARAAAAAAAVP